MQSRVDFLPPLLHPAVKTFVETDKGLVKYVDQYGSPLHVLFPKVMKENINIYRQTFADLDIKGTIFFASKANKSSRFLTIAKQEKINVEVCSIYELRSALRIGLKGKRIVVSGPAKSIE